jgi:hypothetical protein
LVRRLFGDLAYRSGELKEALTECGILLVTERSGRRPGVRQQVEIALASLKRVFGLGETLATTLTGLARRIATKIAAYITLFSSTGFWVGFKEGSRSFGRENLATVI